MDEIHGGSAYGAGMFSKWNNEFWWWKNSFFPGTYAGNDGSRKPTNLELQVAEHQGSHFTQVATALKIGRAALPPKDASPPDPKQK